MALAIKQNQVPKHAPAFVTAARAQICGQTPRRALANPRLLLLFLSLVIQIWEIMERIDATFQRTDGAHSDHTFTHKHRKMSIIRNSSGTANSFVSFLRYHHSSFAFSISTHRLHRQAEGHGIWRERQRVNENRRLLINQEHRKNI